MGAAGTGGTALPAPDAGVVDTKRIDAAVDPDAAVAGMFVAPMGRDDNPGTLDLPWKTISHCASVAQPGDTCWLRAGVYRETVHPAQSGLAGKPIRFAAWAAESVTVSGAQVVAGDAFSVWKDSIWQATVAAPRTGYAADGLTANQVFVGGRMMIEARWPNTGLDLMRPKFTGGGPKKSGTTVVVTHKDIPVIAGGWVGGTLWTNEWFVSRTGTITAEGPGTVTATAFDSGDFAAGYWFYLTGRLGALDAEGEFFFDGGKLYIWPPGGARPAEVEYKQRVLAFDLTDRSYIEVRGLKIFAATIATGDGSTGVVVDKVDARYVSHHVTLPLFPAALKKPNTDDDLIIDAHIHDTGIILRGKGNALTGSRVTWSAGNGVLVMGQGHTVSGNIIENTDYASTYAAGLQLAGSGHHIDHNTFGATGRSAINVSWHLNGETMDNVEIAYNDFHDWGALSADLGAVYICCYTDLATVQIHHNRLHDPIIFSPFWDVAGIYLDIEAHNGQLHHNVMWAFGGDRGKGIKGGSTRGTDRITNNTLLMPVWIGKGSLLRNNIMLGKNDGPAATFENSLGVGADPKFTDAKAGDFTLLDGSPAIDKGAVIQGITDDAVGAPDIGAYERGRPPWQAGAPM